MAGVFTIPAGLPFADLVAGRDTGIDMTPYGAR